MKDKFNITFARFPYGGTEHYRSTNWVIETVIQCKSDSRIDRIHHMEYNDTPITMTRNKAIRDALDVGSDFLVVIDSDMAPDIELGKPGAKPFWDTSWEFILNHYEQGPCCIAAPYCGPPPEENIYVFLWRNWNSGDPQFPNFSLEQFTREEAASRIGIEPVGALPTGLMIIDLRCIEALPKDKAWFHYEYTDWMETTKASTEDVVFTRNLSILGVPQYVNWDAWAGHIKQKIVSKPQILTGDYVAESLRNAIIKGNTNREKVCYMRNGKPLSEMGSRSYVLSGSVLQDLNAKYLEETAGK